MKFRYIAVAEDYVIHGTNDEAKAKKCAEFSMVWDMQTGEYVHAEHEVVSTQGTLDIEEMPEEWFTGVDVEKL